MARVRVDQGSTFPFRCSTFHATTHLYPARRMVADVCGIDPASGLDEAPGRLREVLGRCGLEHHLPLFGALVGVPPGPEFPGPELDGQMLREATLAALLEWIEAEAAGSAGALIVDDIQWADPSTIELLNRVITRRAARVLVLLASRNEFEAPWSSIEAIELGPLAGADLEGIAAASPAASGMTAADVERLARRSDGVPLYFEELLRLEEQPSGGPAPRLASSETAIPPALLDPLLARIAAPGIELGLIQTLACIGQEVRHDLLAAVVDLPDSGASPRPRGAGRRGPAAAGGERAADLPLSPPPAPRARLRNAADACAGAAPLADRGCPARSGRGRRVYRRRAAGTAPRAGRPPARGGHGLRRGGAPGADRRCVRRGDAGARSRARAGRGGRRS